MPRKRQYSEASPMSFLLGGKVDQYKRQNKI